MGSLDYDDEKSSVGMSGDFIFKKCKLLCASCIVYTQLQTTVASGYITYLISH